MCGHYQISQRERIKSTRDKVGNQNGIAERFADFLAVQKHPLIVQPKVGRAVTERAAANKREREELADVFAGASDRYKDKFEVTEEAVAR